MKKSNRDILDAIDEAAEESFPSSDPPAWTLGTDKEAATAEEVHDIKHILSHEHYVIGKVVGIILKLIQAIEQDHKINVGMFKTLISLSEKFIDQGHQKKEELLYPKLKEGDEHPSEYMINNLINEHHHGDQLLAEILQTLDLYQHDKGKAKQEFLHLLKEIRSLQHNHIAKEEEYIIPKINQLVGQQEQKKLVAQFDEIDADIGVNTGDELLSLAVEMEKKYLH